MSDLGTIFLLSLLAMFNPTLLAAVTLMLLTEHPKRLMLGYLLGAYTTSITVGLAIVFALHDSGAVSTSKQTIGPVEDLVIGGLLLLVAYVLGTDRDQPLRERRERRKLAKQSKNGKEKKEPLPMRLLGRGSPRIAFVVGLLLSFPGVSYLTGLSHIDKLEAGVAPTVLLVIAFCLVQQLLLEVPLVGYILKPEATQGAVDGFRDWLARNGRRAGIWVAVVLGALLVIRGIAGLVS
ncbi:MAG TPA: GAP family protein [Solirubrobacterales bacterium]|nr:GAP family protein [Solirubrobacterales bacterium]